MVTSRQLTVSSTRRDAWVEVDLGAIEHNVAVILSWLAPQSAGEQAAVSPASPPAGCQTDADHPDQRAGHCDPPLNRTQASAPERPGKEHRPSLMAVVKSDAYGHGAAGVAQVLIGSGAQWLAVASVDEGCQLRAVDNKVPILVLSPTPSWAVRTALEHNLDLTVTSTSQVSEVASVAERGGRPARIHLKVDTGMHRLGIAPQGIEKIVHEIKKSDHLQLVSCFSHLAMADNAEATNKQNVLFQEIVQSIKKIEPELVESGHVHADEPLLFHLASGDAAWRFPDTHYDMVRVGLLLYGLEARRRSEVVTAAMSVRGRINHLREIEPGQSAGYSWTWTAKRRTRLATIPIGYADGVDRGLSNKLEGILMGKVVPQVGNISMDQMLFDITDVAQAQEGDVITLIGTDGEHSIQLAEWAQMLDTITYELACRMRVRLPRIYTRHRSSSGTHY